MSPATHALLDSLLKQLEQDDPVGREYARRRLVALGPAAAAPLTRLLESESIHLRWEAVKALEEIADPRTASSLIGALDDEIPEIRFMAAEALIALGQDGLLALLRTLIQDAHSGWLREGAHHVLYHYASYPALGPIVRPVLEAMRSYESGAAVPLAAGEALEHLLLQHK